MDRQFNEITSLTLTRRDLKVDHIATSDRLKTRKLTIYEAHPINSCIQLKNKPQKFAKEADRNNNHDTNQKKSLIRIRKRSIYVID